ncbi:MAG: endonuclease/exonuclease/phosphatase family protein [Desulfobacula sp.]|nr:endonuclease/exonuclease/phosphatase family protein [Desulfobacula sp.]
MKKIIKLILTILGLFVLGFAGLVGYATLSDYKPGPTTLVYENKSAAPIPSDQIFNLMIWNIGYAGLSKDMDFFYDGGKQVRPKESVVKTNLAAIEQYLARQNNMDFILLQEVDQNSKRSYSINEYSIIANVFPKFHSSFGKNYDVFFVPVPVNDPLGHVRSGLQTLSRFEPFSIVRHSFLGNYAWPQGLFMLDRCFMVARYHLENSENQLLVINTHNSAYDDGSLRSKQMAYLEKFLVTEYKKGNYVIVGGDWNQCPPAFISQFGKNKMDNNERMDIAADYMPDWNWAYDPITPTNRRLSTSYNEKTTLTTVIDFFLLSPNIDVQKVKGFPLGFEHADHQPVKLTISLKNGQ